MRVIRNAEREKNPRNQSERLEFFSFSVQKKKNKKEAENQI